MRSLVRVFVGLSSIVGGLGTIAAGDLRLLGVAIAIAVVGMIPVSLLLMPGMFFLGALAAALENRVGAINDGRWFWAGAVLGSLNAMIVQLIWLLACAWVFAGATNGNTAPLGLRPAPGRSSLRSVGMAGHEGRPGGQPLFKRATQSLWIGLGLVLAHVNAGPRRDRGCFRHVDGWSAFGCASSCQSRTPRKPVGTPRF